MSSEQTHLLRADEVSLTYQDGDRLVNAVDSINLQIQPGEFMGILGPSGSGKSSLLYLLSGLKLPSKGEVLFKERAFSQMNDSERSALRRRQFGFVFQQPYLLGYLNVVENVLVIAERPQEQLVRAMELLKSLGLQDKAHRFPNALSGGERQRACVARALLMEPEVIFADEPTASLDHTNGFHVMELLEACRGKGAVVLVTHDPQMLKHSNRVCRLEDGKIVE